MNARAFALVAAMSLLAVVPAPAAEPPIVVELYTSQGCNSCPPADRMLRDLAARPGVLALSFHVDYWDYIGWKDGFAQPAFTERQRAYQRVLGARYVYTPQAVIAGAAEVVGSDRAKLEAAIRSARRPSVAITHESGRLRVAGGKEGPATLWLVRFDSHHEVDILRGENGGKRLAYAHVVREWTRLGAWNGAALDLALEPPAGQPSAVILQLDGPGAVLGVYRFDRAS